MARKKTVEDESEDGLDEELLEDGADAADDASDGVEDEPLEEEDEVEAFFSAFADAPGEVVFKVERRSPDYIDGIKVRGLITGPTGRFTAPITRDEIEERIGEVHGGGTFLVRATVGNVFRGSKTIEIGGPPKLPPELQPRPPFAPSAGTPPIPPAVPVAGAAPSADPFLARALDRILDRLDERVAPSAATGADPLLATLLNKVLQPDPTVSAALEALEQERRERAKERLAREKRARRAEKRRFRELEARLKAKKKPKNPFSKIDQQLTELAMFSEKMDLFRERDRKNGGGLMARVWTRVEPHVDRIVDKLVDEAEAIARQQQATAPRPANDDEDEGADGDEETGMDTVDNVATFSKWVEAIAGDESLVRDPRKVSDSLDRWPTLLNDFASCLNKSELVVFAGRVLGTDAARTVEAPGNGAIVAIVLARAKALRETLQKLRAPKAPVPVAPPAPPTNGAGAAPEAKP